MKLFPFGHATHPQWQMAAGLVLAQLRAQMALPTTPAAPTLGLLYITDHYAPHAQDILDHLGAELPEVTDWSGTVGVGIASSNVEYFDEPALAVMLCAVPSHQYRVFSGVAPLAPATFRAAHGAGARGRGTPDVAELIAEMADRTATGYLFGGLASSRSDVVQFAIGGNGNMRGQGKAGGVFRGGLSGVAFGEGVQLVSRVTQGCQPVGAARTITGADGNLVLTLDGEPALDVLLDDLPASRWTSRRPRWPRCAHAGRPERGAEDVVGRTGTSAPTSWCGTSSASIRAARRGHRQPRWRRHALAFCRATWRPRAPTWCASAPRSARSSSRRNCRWRRGQPRWRRIARRVAAAPSPERRIAGAVYVSLRRPRRPALRRPAAPNCRSCGARWATCRWWASSPAARSRAATCTATPAC
jgi:hypothetical protein